MTPLHKVADIKFLQRHLQGHLNVAAPGHIALLPASPETEVPEEVGEGVHAPEAVPKPALVLAGDALFSTPVGKVR